MVYSRPKAIKTKNWTKDEVSGPWLDDKFHTETTTRLDVFTSVGFASHILKSSIVKFWSQLDVLKVVYPICDYPNPDTKIAWLAVVVNL